MSDEGKPFGRRAEDRLGVREDAAKVAAEARALRRALDEITVWSAQRRRRVAVLLAFAIVLAIQAHDQHLDRCGAGQSIASPSREAVQRDVGRSGLRHAVCDATFPLHAHGGSSWPTPASIVGLVLYGIGGVVSWRWYKAAPHAPRLDGEVDED